MELKGLEQLKTMYRSYAKRKPMKQRYIGTDIGNRVARIVSDTSRNYNNMGELAREKGKKIVSIEHRSRSGKNKELLGFYYLPDENSPLNKLVRKMGNMMRKNK